MGVNVEAEAMQRVLDDPWPDAPRAAFAQAVESANPQRSNFVRAGLRLALALRGRARYSESSAIEIELRQAAPLAQRELWCAGLHAALGARTQVRFGRGFPEGITVDAGAFLSRAVELYAAAPILDLRVSGLEPVADAFFQSRLLSRIRSLEFVGYPMTAENVAKLSKSPSLGKLLWLNLYAQPCGLAGFESLAGSSSLPRLTWVGGSGGQTPNVNPLPREDESGVYGYSENPFAADLVRRFGPRPWLSAQWNSHEDPRPEALSAPEG